MNRNVRNVARRRVAAAVASAIVLAMASAGAAALLRPLEGSGNFLSTVDLLSRTEADGTRSVILLIQIPNRELTFRREHGALQGEVGVKVDLAGEDGAGGDLQTTVSLVCPNEEAATSPTTYQHLPLVLTGVRARSGRLSVVIEDHNRERPGLMSRLKRGRWARSETVADWVASDEPRAEDGLTLGSPVFLAKAPIGLWRDQGVNAVAAERSVLTDYLHPNRRYGLEQSHLQIYFEVDAPAVGGAEAARDGVYLQVLAKDLAFVLRDTLAFAQSQLPRLAQGGTTGVFFDLDLKDLPPGAYQLGAAPGSGRGSSWLAEFDVVWSVHSLNRHGEDVLGEGRTVLDGDELEDFEAAGQAEQEAILEHFWAGRDPDPSTPVNEAYFEFRRRVSYAREYLGGFNQTGAIDPRGQVYLMLGPPNEISRQVLPLNQHDQEDAIAQVHDGYQPEREGTQIKSSGGIPLALTRQAERDIATRRPGTALEGGFELWEYNHAGDQIFPCRYNGQNLGLRFLFCDRTGTGSWRLESTNAVNLGG